MSRTPVGWGGVVVGDSVPETSCVPADKLPHAPRAGRNRQQGSPGFSGVLRGTLSSCPLDLIMRGPPGRPNASVLLCLPSLRPVHLSVHLSFSLSLSISVRLSPLFFSLNICSFFLSLSFSLSLSPSQSLYSFFSSLSVVLSHSLSIHSSVVLFLPLSPPLSVLLFQSDCSFFFPLQIS